MKERQLTTATSAPAQSPPPRISILGVGATPFDSYEQAVQCVAGVIEQGRKSFWAAVNPQKVWRAWRDRAVFEVLQQAEAGIVDGVGVSIASKILHGRSLFRVTGCDLFFALVREAASRGWRIFLLGASPESNRKAAQNLQDQYPGLQIVGRQDGFFKDTAEVISQINAVSPDIVFVAMGSPRQEFWIRDHLPQIDARFFLGVGGSFDVASGANSRAPAIFRKTGTEFLYQLITQPWRWRRQIIYTPFMLKVIAARVLGKHKQA